MNAHEIDRIANGIVSALSGGSGPGLLGCGAVSSGQNYDLLECSSPAAAFFVCADGNYECGGEAIFGCCAGFDCMADFYCPGPSPFECLSPQTFVCLDTFTCGPDTFGSRFSCIRL